MLQAYFHVLHMSKDCLSQVGPALKANPNISGCAGCVPLLRAKDDNLYGLQG